ncbi:AAA family ATPase [Bacillus cereus group sp. BfR-BA-01363]|uniref:AAA family ATPase n=1 Tax=Bacillus cereus group sp. BfR-BA-01363 TaxID=3094882 RepID=UPI0029C45E10|nr:AAA family ATPase [Bacillus cereus group sp. BfR-BA-01363]MDX5853127.1 AAA family ATPase [Bacillus cereus group sp. BfR-BA-01363]
MKNVLRFLYFGDMHERPSTPSNRIDNYQQSISAKREEIKELGNKYKVTAFLQPGDFLNSHTYQNDFLLDVVSKWSMVDTFDLVKLFSLGKLSNDEFQKKLIDAKPIPMIGAIGNHELVGESLNSYKKTSLRFLEQIGFMQLASKENPIIFEMENGKTVAITATHYHHGMDKKENLSDYIIEKKSGDYHIHIVHGYLTNKDMGNLFRHTLVDEIAHLTKADLTITGHDHIGFPITEVDGKYFVNPGAIPRMKSDLKEMRRKPKVLLIEIDEVSGLKVKTIYLKSAKKAEEVLDRTKIMQKKEKQGKMEEIKSIVNKANIGKATNITEVIEVISENENVSKVLKDEVIERITSKMKSLTKENVVADSYYITKMVLENFQSHENTTLDFSKGLNLFTGESGQGKSAVIRAFAFIFENFGRNPRRFIKKGANFARVTIHLSTGYVISRIVEKSKSGKNGYEIYNPKDGSVESTNTKGLSLVQEILGFNKLNIDTDNDVPINFMKQGTSWFFVGDGYTSSERAKIVGSIYGTHYADAVIRDLEGDLKKYNKQIEMADKERKIIQESIDYFDHLPQTHMQIIELEKLSEEVNVLMAKKEKIATLLKEQELIDNKINELNDVIKDLGQVENLHSEIYQVKEMVQKRNEIQKLYLSLTTIIADGKESKHVEEQLLNLPNAQLLLNEIKELAKSKSVQEELLTQSTKLTETKNRLVKEIDVSSEVIEKTNSLVVAESTLSELKELIAKKDTVQSLTNRLSAISEEEKQQNQKIEHVISKNEKLVNDYKILLTEIGKCPVCHGTIDNAVINRITDEYSMEKLVS